MDNSTIKCSQTLKGINMSKLLSSKQIRLAHDLCAVGFKVKEFSSSNVLKLQKDTTIILLLPTLQTKSKCSICESNPMPVDGMICPECIENAQIKNKY